MPVSGIIFITLFVIFCVLITIYTIRAVRKDTIKANSTPPIFEELSKKYGLDDARAEKEKLRTTGTPGRAKVITIEHTGTTINEQPQCRVGLEIQPDSGQPYNVEITQVINVVALPRVQPGLIVQVRIDQANPLSVAIDI